MLEYRLNESIPRKLKKRQINHIKSNPEGPSHGGLSLLQDQQENLTLGCSVFYNIM